MSNPPRLSEHFDDLTQIEIDGAGLFDELMQASKAHLKEEYDNQRIRGSDYTQAYIASMQSALGNAVQYIIGMRLVDAELAKLTEDTALVTAQIALTESQKEQQDYITKVQLPAQVDLTDAQTESENTLRPIKVAQLEAETGLAIQQTALTLAQTDTENLTRTAKIDQLYAEIDKLNAEILKIAADNRLSDAQVNLVTAQALTEESTRSRIAAETILIYQKNTTEIEQVRLIGAQIDLYNRQAVAFDDEKNYKAAKIQADIFAVMRTTDEATIPNPTLYNP